MAQAVGILEVYGLVYFNNRGFTKHYDTKIRLLFEYAKWNIKSSQIIFQFEGHPILEGDQPQQKQGSHALFCQHEITLIILKYNAVASSLY